MVLRQAVDTSDCCVLVIVEHAADKYSCRRSPELLHRVPGRFHALVHCLEEQSLLGIHGLGFLGVDGEEVAIEATGIFIKEVGVLDVGTLGF